jgi:hypothetical protein
LVPYSDSVYKTLKILLDLLLLKLLHGGKLLSNVNSKEKGVIHVSPVLDVGLLRQGREGCCDRGGKEQRRQGMSGGGRKKNDRRKELSRLFIES